MRTKIVHNLSQGVEDEKTRVAIKQLERVVSTIGQETIKPITVDVGAGTETKVQHRLGRVPVGFLVIDSDEDVRVWRSGRATANEITLTASANATVSLWIF